MGAAMAHGHSDGFAAGRAHVSQGRLLDQGLDCGQYLQCLGGGKRAQ